MDNCKNIIEKKMTPTLIFQSCFFWQKTQRYSKNHQKCKKWPANWMSTSVSIWSKFTWVLYDDNLYVVFSTSVTDVNIRVHVYFVVLFYVFLQYVIIGVNTSSLKMASLVKCGRWEIGGQKNVRGGKLGVTNCGRWEIGGQNLWVVPIGVPIGG